jgi:hypothetical protein
MKLIDINTNMLRLNTDIHINKKYKRFVVLENTKSVGVPVTILHIKHLLCDEISGTLIWVF